MYLMMDSRYIPNGTAKINNFTDLSIFNAAVLQASGY